MPDCGPADMDAAVASSKAAFAGEWRSWTTATVSADGSRIQTADGEGIAYLTWFGLYPR